jgi:DNA-binding response OmpR family regulator
MPVLNGYETTQTLREKGCKVPIVAVTAKSELDERANVLKLGMNDILWKVCLKLLARIACRVVFDFVSVACVVSV